MIRRHYIVQYDKTETPSRFEKPMNPAMSILLEFQQEFSFVTSLGEVPNLIWNVVSFRTCHEKLPIFRFLTPKIVI